MAEPRFSIVTPVYETPAGVLRAMLRSVRRQSFARLGAVPGRRRLEPSRTSPRMLERAAARATRGSGSCAASENGGIVAASNDALAMARGEFVALLDHDDKLHPDALAYVAEALDDEPRGRLRSTPTRTRSTAPACHSGPFFKPDWSPERMRTQMYTCHLSVLRRSLVEEVGGFDPEFEGSQDWDLVLRVTERARSVVHVPRVLYHWRTLETSAAGGGEAAKPWAFEAGKRAVQAHCERIGLQARVERDEATAGRLPPRAPRSTREPTVSIVIPTERPAARGPLRGGRRWSSTASAASSRRSTYDELRDRLRRRRLDADPALLDELRGDRRRPAARRRLRPSPSTSRPRSTSAPRTARASTCCCSTTTWRSSTPDWIERMVMYSQHPGIGAVGAPPALGGRPPPARRGPLRERRAPGPPLPRLRRRLQGLREQRPSSPRTASRSPAPA